jgi:hypothetical protein
LRPNSTDFLTLFFEIAFGTSFQRLTILSLATFPVDIPFSSQDRSMGLLAKTVAGWANRKYQPRQAAQSHLHFGEIGSSSAPRCGTV